MNRLDCFYDTLGSVLTDPADTVTERDFKGFPDDQKSRDVQKINRH